MFKPNKLLKVISILIIIFSVLNVVSAVFMLMSGDSIAEMTGMEIPASTYITSLILAIADLAIGIIGLAPNEASL